LMVLFTLAESTEGGVDTWGVLFLRTRLAAGVLLGAGAYALGQGAAALTRSTGGGALGRLGTKRAVLLGATIVTIGMAIEANVTTAAVAGLGLALGACGASLFWPLIISEVNDNATEPLSAVGAFTAAGYVGLVAGAPIVGWIADNFGLGRGIDVLAGLGAVVALSQVVRMRRNPTSRRSR
jgi:MFS family permease